MSAPASTNTIGYLDLPSGVSGDMLLGCLVDAGWPVDDLIATVRALHLPAENWTITAERVMRGPLAATLVHVTAPVESHHRHLSDIQSIIAASDLPATVQARAIDVFTRLAAAEAAVHGVDVKSIHFHEVGALDAIIDIVGVCAGLHALGVTQLYAGALPLGSGWVNSAHGKLPVPAPATLALLAAAGAPSRPAPGPGELVTPTGAALVCALAEFRQPAMSLRRIGYGAGQKQFDWPNVARLWLGEATTAAEQPGTSDMLPAMVQLETNLDDMNPEHYGPLVEHLLAAGAADVWLTPVQMKKGRPGIVVSVLAAAAHEAVLARLLLEETTTLGVRVHVVHRHEAERSFATVETVYGPVRVKLKLIDGTVNGAKPEHDDCVRLGHAHQVSPRQVEMAAIAAAYATIIAPAG